MTTNCSHTLNPLTLKNLIRTETSRHGRATWQLHTLSGEPIEAFNVFCAQIADLSERTQKRYAEVLSRFLDYLYEVGLFSPEGVTARKINDAVEAYPQLLRDGSTGLIERIEARGSYPDDAWLVEVARALNWKRLKPGSFSNTLAAVNRFLDLSETLARQELERARLLGLPADQPDRLIRALDAHGNCLTNC